MRRLIAHGVTNFKCATSLELLTVCEAGGHDVLIAYQAVGRNAERVVEIAKQFPLVSVSAPGGQRGICRALAWGECRPLHRH